MEKTDTEHIPEEAYLYFPNKGEQHVDEGKKMVRWIFEGNTQYTEFEKFALQEFEKELEKKYVKFPDEWHQNKCNSLKFLHANKWDHDKAIKTIQEYLEWKKVNTPVKISPEIEKFLNSGIIYVHGRDNRFRPIIVINIYKMDPKEIDVDQMLKAITYFLEYIIETLLLPGQVENWVIIQDLNGMGVTSLPLGMIKQVLGFLQNNFRARLFKAYTMNCPGTIYWGWKLVKPLMEETTAAKINLVKDSATEDMWKHIEKSQVEKKYGGNAESPKQLWPPVFPSDKYFIETDKTESILISKDDYRKMVNDGKLSLHKVSKALV